ncbi:hypothetical protein [Halostreptopolyspora alba]|uniref:Exonuclease n=1 Tax=Halostreptopolyspora alba TaxID=2487137 RepID=A0A3N0E2G0_9ACTN|nr:hypothetical protein EFW17_20765 [Nocardiopsaceae bacterium YIM 96095]
MAQRLFLVDVEASAPTPYRGVMTEFGVVGFETRDWFHGHLWDSHPDPEVPARPVAEREAPGWTTNRLPRHDVATAREVFTSLHEWMAQLTEHDDRPVFVSDNPGYDVMWMAEGFDRAGMVNPFGHSARRIGDLAAGLSGNWKNTSEWKKHRRTPHDHNPVNDALGNAEALRAILVRHGQIAA